MKRMKVIALILISVIAIGAGLTLSGYGGELFFKGFIAYNKPNGAFDPSNAITAPDYSDQSNWAALPEMKDPADLIPQGITTIPQGEHLVDTFFIHPTGFLTTASWTSPMDENSGTEENTQWMMANQASAFNGCCNIYAPRYREANIFAYFATQQDREALLDFAYQDVKRAFEYYLDNYNEGRPFILASHSQGTHHSMRLMSELIDTTNLHSRMVAAYTIGGAILPMPKQWFASMKNIKPCQSQDDLHCVIHWDTMPLGAEPMQRDADSLCTNPLTWRVDEELASQALNAGAVIPTGTFNSSFGKVDDIAQDQVYETLSAPIPQLTSAQCRDGSLFVERQIGNAFASVGSGMMDTYHEIDYALFYMNIHHNARLRSERYFSITNNAISNQQ